MLIGDRRAEMDDGRHVLLRECDPFADRRFELFQRIAATGAERLVVFLMFAAVDGFLCGEAAHMRVEYRIADLVAIVLYAVDEVLLTDRKHDRERIVKSGAEWIAAMPVGRERLFHIEVDVARFYRNIIGRVGKFRIGHGGPLDRCFDG